MPAPLITVSTGLLSPQHAKAIGPALWEFLALIDRQTTEDGTVNGGKPITVGEISARTGRCDKTTRANIARLEEHGYISKRQSGAGLIVRISNAKKRFKAGRKLPTGSVENYRADGGEIGRKLPRDRQKTTDRTIYKQENSKEGAPHNGALPLCLTSPAPKPAPGLTPFGVCRLIAEAGDLDIGKPTAKALAQAKRLIAANVSEDDIRLTVRHLLSVDPAYWNRKRPIDPAAVVEHLPIARKAAKAEPASADYSYLHDPARYFPGTGARAKADSL